MATNGEEESGAEEGSESEVAELLQKVESLQQELKTCKKELTKLQKQLTNSERLQKSTEGYNEDLRKQVDKLSAEIHERKKVMKEMAEAETQTEEYTWSETDYYNYYYGGGFYQGDVMATDAQGTEAIEGHKATDASEMTAAESTANTAKDIITGTTADADTAMVTEGFVGGGVAAVQPEPAAESGSIADILRATAEQAMTQTGFVFDETTGMYYDHSTGFYYDSASQLYYDNNTGIYYYCDTESGKYQFHSRIEIPTEQPASETSQDKKIQDKKGRKWRKGPDRPSRQDEKVEDVANSLANMKISYFWNSASCRAEELWAPCVRVTVIRSPVLQTGTLFIITADAPATIGREKDMNHAITISDIGVSKFHAEVYYDQEHQCYMIVDQGSQNGTVLNGNRILQPKAKCDPFPLTHGDEVKMGDTVLSFHIHYGTDTCDGCEPGQVMAHLGKHQKNQPLQTGPAKTKEDKEVLRQKELKQMKVKYGLKSSEYEEAKALKNPKYVDRAESRRQTVGSEGAFQRDDAPASVHVEISEVNKGRKMLEKMGWKKGEGLGKDGDGMKDPIQLKIRKSQTGLGVEAAVSVDEAGSLSRTKTQRNFEKARERFNQTCHAETPTVRKEQGQEPKPWVKGEVTQ